MSKYFFIGVKDATPIMLGYIPIGLAFGVLASSAGISPLGVALMSLILFAGSAQFITVSMMASFMNSVSIIATIFVVNFRHFLMSSAYSKYFKQEKSSSLALLSFWVTDESFAVGINKAKYDNENFNKSYLFGVELAGYFTWAIFTTLGALIGNIIPDSASLGLDFALPAMFIGLLSLLIKTKRDLIVCLLAGVLVIIIDQTALASFSVIIASVAAALIIVGGSHD